jgi:hypothetical protein
LALTRARIDMLDAPSIWRVMNRQAATGPAQQAFEEARRGRLRPLEGGCGRLRARKGVSEPPARPSAPASFENDPVEGANPTTGLRQIITRVFTSWGTEWLDESIGEKLEDREEQEGNPRGV